MKVGGASAFKKESQHGSAKILYSIFWPAGAGKNGCKKKKNSYHNKPVLICLGSFKLLEFFFVNISKIKIIKIKLAQKLILFNLV